MREMRFAQSCVNKFFDFCGFCAVPYFPASNVFFFLTAYSFAITAHNYPWLILGDNKTIRNRLVTWFHLPDYIAMRESSPTIGKTCVWKSIELKHQKPNSASWLFFRHMQKYKFLYKHLIKTIFAVR